MGIEDESNINFRGILFVNTWNLWTRAYDYELWFNINVSKHERQHIGKDNRKNIHMRKGSTVCKTTKQESLIWKNSCLSLQILLTWNAQLQNESFTLTVSNPNYIVKRAFIHQNAPQDDT